MLVGLCLQTTQCDLETIVDSGVSVGLPCAHFQGIECCLRPSKDPSNYAMCICIIHAFRKAMLARDMSVGGGASHFTS